VRLKATYDSLGQRRARDLCARGRVERKTPTPRRTRHRGRESARRIGSRWTLPSDLDALYRGGLIHDIAARSACRRDPPQPGPSTPKSSCRSPAPDHRREHVAPLARAPVSSRSSATTTSISTARATPTGFRAPAFRGWQDCLRLRRLRTRWSPTVRTGSASRSMRRFAILTAGAGRQWDPEVVDLFVKDVPLLKALGRPRG